MKEDWEEEYDRPVIMLGYVIVGAVATLCVTAVVVIHLVEAGY